jgi:predicted Zn-dependent peptidase
MKHPTLNVLCNRRTALGAGRMSLSVLLAATLMTGARAQTSPAAAPPAHVEFKNRAPVANETLRVKFPRPRKYTLPNGLRVIVVEDHKLPTISLNMSVLAGSFFEPKDKQGLADLTASMLDEGTKSRSSAQIAAAVDRLGASLGASAAQGGERASVYASGLSTDTSTLLGLMRDIVRNPTFPTDQFEKVKARTIAGLTQALQDADTLADIAANRAVYGKTPPARVFAPIPQVSALTAKDAADFHDRTYRPERAILGIVGDVKADDAYAMVKKAFGDWPRGSGPTEAELPDFAPQPKTRVFVVNRPGSVQTTLRVGNLAIARKSPDYYAFMVMNRILGYDPLASRLAANIREAHGYTYDVRSDFDAPRYLGYWGAQTEVRTAVTADTLTQFFKEFKRMETEPVTPTELADAKRGIVGIFALRMERPESLLSMAMTQAIYGLPDDYWDVYPARINAVTASDVQRVADEYIGDGRVQIVAVGEQSAIEDALKPYGPVTDLDLAAELGGPTE